VKIDVVTMTPALATTLLAGNTKNRRLDPRRLRTLATALTNGEYQFDGTPVRIGPGGLVLDGQHRLEAVRLSGVTIQVLLITDMDPSATLVLDTGKPRSFTDYLTIMGVTNVAHIAAACRLLWYYEHGQMTTTSAWSYRTPVTHTVLWDYYQRHQEEITEAVRRSRQVRAQIRVAPAVAAIGYTIFSRIDEEDTDAFYAELSFVRPQSAATALFARTLNGRQERRFRNYNALEQTALLIKTWNMYRRDYTVEKLVWFQSPAKKEHFPVPDGAITAAA